MLQLNGVSLKATREVNVKQTTALINRYDVDMILYQEHGLNMAHFKPSETFDTFFEAEVKLGTVTGFNKTEHINSAHIQGCTGLPAVNEILPYCKTLAQTSGIWGDGAGICFTARFELAWCQSTA